MNTQLTSSAKRTLAAICFVAVAFATWALSAGNRSSPPAPPEPPSDEPALSECRDLVGSDGSVYVGTNEEWMIDARKVIAIEPSGDSTTKP